MSEAEKIKKQHTGQKTTLMLCWLAYAFSYLCRTNLSIALPDMTHQMGWSTASAGAISSAFFLSYAVGHLFNGIMGDRLPIKPFMLLGLLGSSVCNLLIGFFPVYQVVLAVWMLNGFLLSTLWGPIIRAIAVWYPPEERNPPAMVISFSSLAGYLLSWAGLGVLIQLTSWRGAFFLPGIVTLAFSLWFLWKMQDAPQKLGLENYASTVLPNQPAGESISLWQLIRRERLLFFCLAALAQGIIKDGITLWAPTMLQELHGLSAAAVSGAAAWIPVVSFGGVLLSGKLMKRYYGKEKMPGILLFGGTGIYCLLFFCTLGKALWCDVLFFSLISALLSGINTLLLTFIPLRLSSCGKTSTVAGLFNFFAYLGAGCSGILSGVMATFAGWGGSVLLWGILCILGAGSVAGGFARQQTTPKETLHRFFSRNFHSSVTLFKLPKIH